MSISKCAYRHLSPSPEVDLEYLRHVGVGDVRLPEILPQQSEMLVWRWDSRILYCAHQKVDDDREEFLLGLGVVEEGGLEVVHRGKGVHVWN